MGRTAGRSERKGITVLQAAAMFGDEQTAERWFEEWRWPEGVRCVECGSGEISRQPRAPGVPPFRCAARIGRRKCDKRFSIKYGTFMHRSKLPLSVWGMAIYIMVTELKGASSMKLHRALGITQKTAWHLAHRIRNSGAFAQGDLRRAFNPDAVRLGGPETGKTMLKRAHVGTFHHFSRLHARRYVGEFAGRQGSRPMDTVEQMCSVVAKGEGRPLTYDELIRQGRRQRLRRRARPAPN